jgi:hypothetical protein
MIQTQMVKEMKVYRKKVIKKMTQEQQIINHEENNSYLAKINRKFKELLEYLENHRQKLINHNYYQKTVILIEKYGS